ncbi:MAG: hypothetical protein M1826_007222 [Phylliscum demangeonii]|nr:MAG: hypothetical protein M1826_007222 [Phylliscum demangeonii]
MPRVDKKKAGDETLLRRFAERDNANEALATRPDVLDRSERRLAPETQRLHERTIRRFKLMMEKVLQQPWQPYLVRGPDARPPAVALLKRYVLFRAQAGVGRLAPRLSFVTLLGELMALLAEMRRKTGQQWHSGAGATLTAVSHRLCLSKLDRAQISHFVRHDMTDVARDASERLSTQTAPKPVAVTADIVVLLETLATSSVFMDGLTTARDALQLSIFVLLMVDCVARPGELALGGDADSRGHCLQWTDVSLFGHRDSDGAITFFGHVTLQWLKGAKDDDGKYKTIPLTLMPAAQSRYDALRQLMVLAIIDDLLAPWHLLEEAINATSDTPRRLPWRQGAVLQTPVFRVAEPGRVTTAPRGTRWFGNALARLGEIAGFAGRVTPYALRRSAANMVDQKCNESMRTFLMGHTEQSPIFHQSYQSKIAPFDVGSTFWAAPALPIAQIDRLIGMGLDRVQGTPVRMSRAGLQSCSELPAVMAAKHMVDDAKAQMQKRWPTFAAARLAVKEAAMDWSELHEWRQAYTRYSAILRAATNAKLNEERARYRAALGLKIAEPETELGQGPEPGPPHSLSFTEDDERMVALCFDTMGKHMAMGTTENNTTDDGGMSIDEQAETAMIMHAATTSVDEMHFLAHNRSDDTNTACDCDCDSDSDDAREAADDATDALMAAEMDPADMDALMAAEMDPADMDALMAAEMDKEDMSSLMALEMPTQVVMDREDNAEGANTADKTLDNTQQGKWNHLSPLVVSCILPQHHAHCPSTPFPAQRSTPIRRPCIANMAFSPTPMTLLATRPF